MRALTAGEKTRSALEVTHRGWLLALTPVSLDPVYLTTIGADYSDGSTSPATVYLGDPGFVMGQVRVTDGSDPATLDVEIPVSDDGPVTPDDVTRGLWQGAIAVLRIVDYVNGDVSPAIGFMWVAGETRITDDGKAIFEMRASTRISRELILKVFGPVCTANWADSRCGVTAATFTDTVEVVTVVDAYSFTVTGSSRANGFFDNGAVRFTSGDNINRAYTVRKWVLSTSTVTLWEPLRAGLVAGDDATIHAGCDKTTGAAGCTKFSNIARFQGFHTLPGFDVKFTFESPDANEPTPTVVSTTTRPTYWAPSIDRTWNGGFGTGFG
jgi:uncharacterized phage protein (TIGR02218 family)